MSKDAQGTYEEREKEFIKDLTKLSRRYGVQIGGCGCCGSPFLGDIQKDQQGGSYEYNSYLKWKR